ncbi:MAG: hypothetical protein ACRDCG_02200 [Mycoplasmoidaceae bacterium]
MNKSENNINKIKLSIAGLFSILIENKEFVIGIKNITGSKIVKKDVLIENDSAKNNCIMNIKIKK